MHYELWGANPADLIACTDSEAEAYRVVRQFLNSGWKAEDLSLGLEIDGSDQDDVELPPAVCGEALRVGAYITA